MALDHAILTARDRDECPDTLRFMFFEADTVLVGFHQCVELEVDIDYCRQHRIEIGRRLTGGGAILMQPSHIGFEIVCDAGWFDTGLNRKNRYRLISDPIVNALRHVGFNAAYRPLNDIEINGKKVSGTGGVDGKRSLLFHGSILVDMDIETMLGCLKIPIQKISDKALASIMDRITTLRRERQGAVDTELLIERIIREFECRLGVEIRENALTEWEYQLFSQRRAYYASSEWIDTVQMPPGTRPVLHGIHKAPGGMVRSVLVVDQRSRHIQSALITGDFFAADPRVLLDMEARLKGVSIDPGKIRWLIHQAFTGYEQTIPEVTADDFVQSVLNALQDQGTG
ncbi:lipoate--protein ligase family protein [bacterium]|nr:lipoate--protein ligase family protein [candidate division CSSED10-310 bacterium]